jgi:hypothetical protein
LRKEIVKMKKFEHNGFIATVTNDTVRWEISITNLISAYNNNPNCYTEDGVNYASIKRGKRQEFAEYVAKSMFDEVDQETGATYIEEALDRIFDTADENSEEFIKFPECEED